MNYKATKYLENAGSAAADREYQKQVIQPIAKRILEHIKMTGFLGYISEQTLKDAYAAIVMLVRECAEQGIVVDLRQLTDASQTVLLTTIANKTRQVLVPPIACCSTAYLCSFFRPEVTPSQITDHTDEIAKTVKATIRRQSVMEMKESDIYQRKAIKGSSSMDVELDTVVDSKEEETVSSSARVSPVAFMPAVQDQLRQINVTLKTLNSRVQTLESTRL